MEWNTDPIPSFPGATPFPPGSVRLGYLSRPAREFILAGVPELLNHLQKSGKRVVTARFDVLCGWHGFGGWQADFVTVTTVDGQAVPVPSGGGAGEWGKGGDVDPLQNACR